MVESTRGDWDVKAEIYDKPKVYLAHNLGDRRYYGFADPSNSCGTVFSEDPHDSCFPESWFPIPDIGDCLRRLRELFGITQIWVNYPDKGGVEIEFDDAGGGMHGFSGNTLLEACQSALLAVLEGR